MSTRDFHDLVLTVTVESCPLDDAWLLTTPAPCSILASMSHSKIAALVCMRQAHDERSELSGAARGVDVSFELTAGAGVDLYSC